MYHNCMIFHKYLPKCAKNKQINNNRDIKLLPQFIFIHRFRMAHGSISMLKENVRETIEKENVTYECKKEANCSLSPGTRDARVNCGWKIQKT